MKELRTQVIFHCKQKDSLKKKELTIFSKKPVKLMYLHVLK